MNNFLFTDPRTVSCCKENGQQGYHTNTNSGGYFDTFVDNCQLVQRKGVNRISSWDAITDALGSYWDMRLINHAGDFARVNRDTLTVRFAERKPLSLFFLDGSKSLIHRGYIMTIVIRYRE